MTTVVLGGTGFLGSHLVERLAREGGDVVAVSRTGAWRWGTPPGNVRVVPLDLTDRDSQPLAELFAGSDRVVHIAGILARSTTPRSAFHELHVEGTQRVVDALARADAEHVRLVHVSTVGVLGPTGTTPKDEEAPPSPTNAYERSKLLGETIALASRRPRREVAIVRPGLVYGPRDLHLLAWFRAIAKGTYRPIGGGGAIWQPIYVDDVVRGIEAALEVKGADGQTIHLAGKERDTVAHIADRIAAALGRRGARASIPVPIALMAGWLLEKILPDPPLTRARVRTMTQDRVYSIERAQRLLGFEPKTLLEDGLARTVAWYKEQGLLR